MITYLSKVSISVLICILLSIGIILVFGDPIRRIMVFVISILTLYLLGLLAIIIYYILSPKLEYSVIEFKDDMLSNNLVSSEQLLGCTEEDIEIIMNSQNVTTLPQIYLDFLHILGRTNYELRTIEGVFYPNLLENRSIALSHANNLELSLPSNMFIIAITRFDDKLYISFVNNDEGDDPPVYEAQVTAQGLIQCEKAYLKLTYFFLDWITVSKLETTYTNILPKF